MLSGCRVLDFTDEKGAFCAKLLADMGARVTRIETGDNSIQGTAEDLYLNFTKETIRLNLNDAPEREEFKRRINEADVIVESQPPGFMERLGLRYSQLSVLNPRLVMASITGFGQSGPYRDWQSSELVAAAMGGWLSVTGAPGAPPLALYGNQAYCTASLFAANGILLALWERHNSGKGQYLDITVMECVAATLDHVPVRYFYEGQVAGRGGDLYWNHAFKIFPCRDGHVLLTLHMQWETLVEWLESEGMAEDLGQQKYLDRAEREKDLAHIIEVLERWTRSHTAAELVETGQLMRFPWAKVNSIPEVLDCPQLKPRDFFREVEDPRTERKYCSPRLPWRVRQ